MKELFSKVLNWVTLTALIVWIFLNAAIFFFPDNVQFILEMDEKLIWAIIGAVIGAGGMKAKLQTEELEIKAEAAESVPDASEVRSEGDI